MPTEPSNLALRRCRVGATFVSSSVESLKVTQRKGSKWPVADVRCCLTACSIISWMNLRLLRPHDLDYTVPHAIAIAINISDIMPLHAHHMYLVSLEWAMRTPCK
jgi:hypothetical protein